MNRFIKPDLFALVLCIVIGLNACQRKPKVVTIHTNQGLTLIDSSIETNPYPLHESFPIGYYPIYFIGNLNDTLWLERNKIPEYDESKEDSIAYLNKIAQFPDSTNMRIVVDTTLKVPFAAYYVNEKGKELPDSTTYYKSVAVLVYNLTDKPLYVAKFSELQYTVRQSKDSLGNWVDVELPITYFCGTGSQSKFILPGQILIAKALLHKGDLKKECRLKLQYKDHTIYSNTYLDHINSNQLKKPLDEYWN